MSTTFIERRIRRAGLLIFVGLLVQIVTFPLVHPLAFMCFLLVGCPLASAGMLLYLYALASLQHAEQ
jgi:hypothetical protein